MIRILIGGFFCVLLYLGIFFAANLLCSILFSLDETPDSLTRILSTVCYLIAMPFTLVRREVETFLDTNLVKQYDTKTFLREYYKDSGLKIGILYGIIAAAAEILQWIPGLSERTYGFLIAFVMPPLYLVPIPILRALIGWFIAMGFFTLFSVYQHKTGIVKSVTGSDKVRLMGIMGNSRKWR